MKRFIMLFICAAMMLPAVVLADEVKIPAAADRFCQKYFPMIDQGKFDDSYALAATGLDQKKSGFVGMVSEREPMGELKSRKISEVKTVQSFADLPEGEYLMLVYNTEFSKQPETREIVVLLKGEDGEFGLAGYKLEYDRWPEAIKIIGNGIFLVFMIMSLLAFITWAIGRIVQAAEKKKAAQEKG